MIDYRAGHSADDRNDHRARWHRGIFIITGVSTRIHARTCTHMVKRENGIAGVAQLSDDDRTARRDAFIPRSFAYFERAINNGPANSVCCFRRSLSLSLCPIDYGSISFINLNRPRTVTTTNVGNRGAPSFRIRINDHRIVLLLISNSYRERTKRFRQRERERQDSLLRKIRLIITIIIFYSLRLYEGEIYLK